MVADALSCRGPSWLGCMRLMVLELETEIARRNIELVVGRWANITLVSTLLERIRKDLLADPQLVEPREKVMVETTNDFAIS